MNILITGATGFVGAWLTRSLVELGHNVKIIRRNNSDLSQIKDLNVEHCIGDVTDLDSLLVATKDVNVVFHLAGVVGYSKKMRELMEKVNVEGTRNIVEACKAPHIKRLVYMSSVVAIGSSFDGKIPLTETSEYNLQHLNLGYFETKHRAEQIVKTACDDGLIDAVILNPSTIYGPGDSKKGSRKTQLQVAKGQFPFYTSGGVNIVYIEDVIQALIQAWKLGHSGERYILAGENILIKDLFKMIAECAGVQSPYIYLPNPVIKTLGFIGDFLEKFNLRGPINSENAWTAILYHWFDSSKAQAELNFKVTPARIAINKSIQWSKKEKII